MTDQPVVSIVIPVRNRVKTIADAVNSALNQITDFPFNIIVVDNYSTDGTFDVLVHELVGCTPYLRVNPVIGSVAAEVGRSVVIELNFLCKCGRTETKKSCQTERFHSFHCVLLL